AQGSRRTVRPLEALGTLPRRAPVGHGARRLQPPRPGLALLPPRPRALARLPVGRGRARWDHRQPRPALLRPGPLERSRPPPEGAAVRADRKRGQPRRGREGVLLLSRLDTDALLHEVPVQVPAGGVSVLEARRGEPAAGPARARVRADGHGRLRGGPLLRRAGRVREGGARRPPDPDHRDESRPRGRRAAPPAAGVASQHLVLGCPSPPGRARRCAGAAPTRRSRGAHSAGTSTSYSPSGWARRTSSTRR